MSKIIISNDFNPSQLKYAEPKKNKHGSLSIWVQPKTIIQTPVMDCPFDVQVFEEEKTGNKTYSLSLSFRGMDEKPKLKNFHEKLVELDNKLIDDGVTNQKKWFKKKGFTKEVIKGAFYNPIVKVSMTDGEPDGKFPPTMKLKLPMLDNKFMVKGYNHKKEEIDLLENLGKGAKVKALIEIRSLWFGAGKYGLVIRPLQLKIKAAPSKLTGYSFIEDSDDEDNNEDTDEDTDSDE